MKTYLALAAFSAFATLIVATPSQAEQVAYSDDDGVVVIAPYAVHRDGPLGEQTVSVTRVVDAGGLDLRYTSDVEAFHQRVVDTARLACDEADDATHGQSLTSDRECVRQAVDHAMPQFRAVVSRANY